jgi:hypothetical protein
LFPTPVYPGGLQAFAPHTNNWIPGGTKADAFREKRVADLIVYRPAEGAGQSESRRLRLGGKQKHAGCPSIKPRKLDDKG